MAEKKSRAKSTEKEAKDVDKREEEEAEEEEYVMYDLKVTAEDRGYEVEEPQLAPENELREDPKDHDSPKSVNNEADEERDEKAEESK